MTSKPGIAGPSGSGATIPGRALARWRRFLAFENLVLGANASLPERAEPVPVPVPALIWLCRAYGSTTTRRAYADWVDTRFGRYQQALERNGIDLVQIGHGPAGKNGADSGWPSTRWKP